jgi:CBS domain containing-hemolysin-like protein
MSAGTAVVKLVLALGLVALNGFFVAVEFAVVATRHTRIDRLIADGNATARIVRRLIGNPDRVIAGSQLGITIASLALGWIGESTVAALIEPALAAMLGRWSVAAAHTIGTLSAFALVTFVHIVLGEQVPKTLAIRYAERAALTVAIPMDAFLKLFRPLIAVLDGATAAVVRLLRAQPIAGHRSVYTLDELKLLVRESQQGGAIEAGQEEMLQNVFLFGERQVYEVMIPRTDIVGIEQDASIRDLLQAFASASHARFPVYGQDLDNIVGILAIKDVMLALAEDPARAEMPIRSLVRPALFVPGSVAVASLLARMRASHDQMAVILDEYGGTAGMVTLEGLVEEIVGQVSDELVVTEQPVVRVNDTTVEIDAQMRVEDANEELGLALPEGEDYETVAGMILFYLQRVPREGDELEQPGLVLRVTQMLGRKIERVQVRRNQ